MQMTRYTDTPLHYTLHTTHYTLHTTHCTLHTTHYTLHTTHCSTHLFVLKHRVPPTQRFSAHAALDACLRVCSTLGIDMNTHIHTYMHTHTYEQILTHTTHSHSHSHKTSTYMHTCKHTHLVVCLFFDVYACVCGVRDGQTARVARHRCGNGAVGEKYSRIRMNTRYFFACILYRYTPSQHTCIQTRALP
jgi:hypothetical protein